MKRIINDIQPYSVKDYQSITNEFTAYFSQKYKEKLSLYQFGNTSHPSVSDLDLAIVIDEETISENVIQNIVQDSDDFIKANTVRQYIFIHGILIYSKKTFSMAQYIHFTSNLHLLAGEPVPRIDIVNIQALEELHFIAYDTNVLKNFERIVDKKEVGLRRILKVLQNAFHEFRILEKEDEQSQNIENKELYSERIKQMRSWAYQTEWNREAEQKLICFVDEVFIKLKDMHVVELDKLSIKIFGEKIAGSVYVLENGHLEKRHRLFVELAASYTRIYKEERNCYAQVHKKMFPVKKEQFKLTEPYEALIREQAKALLPACRLYKEYGATQVLGPMMCYHCSPVISIKQKFVGMAQWVLFRLQGL